MQTDQLRLFVDVAAAKSFTRAATLAGSTQSAVSKRMLALEREVGVRLFERTGRGARLTDAGRLLLPRAERLTGELEGIADTLAADLGRPRGVVRLALQPSISWPLMARIYAQGSSAYPDIRMRVYEATAAQIDEWLRQGRIDVAVISRVPHQAPSREQPLIAPVMHLVSRAGDPATRAPTVPFSRLPSLPLMLSAFPNYGRVMLEEEARRRGIKLNVVLELNSIYVMKRLIATSGGYTVASSRAVQSEIVAGELSTSKIVRPQLEQRFYLILAENRPPTVASRVVAELVRALLRESDVERTSRVVPKVTSCQA